jgi:uncharacterized protein YggL (DUF469 family)
MKRRLRKKLRLKEFQEMGFHLSYRFAQGVSAEARDRHLAEFIDFIEGHQLTCGGGGDEVVSYFIAHVPRGSVSESQQATVEAWLGGRKEVTSLQMGQLIDAWHG